MHRVKEKDVKTSFFLCSKMPQLYGNGIFVFCYAYLSKIAGTLRIIGIERKGGDGGGDQREKFCEAAEKKK